MQCEKKPSFHAQGSDPSDLIPDNSQAIGSAKSEPGHVVSVLSARKRPTPSEVVPSPPKRRRASVSDSGFPLDSKQARVNQEQQPEAKSFLEELKNVSTIYHPVYAKSLAYLPNTHLARHQSQSQG